VIGPDIKFRSPRLPGRFKRFLLLSLLLEVILLGGCGDSFQPTPSEQSPALAVTGPSSTTVAVTAPVAFASVPATNGSGSDSRPFVLPKNGKTLQDWAGLLVQNIKPADTDYQHTSISVTWAGQAGASAYTSHTDCSGFIIALLSQTYGLGPVSYQGWLKTARPLAETFYRAINTRKGFKNIQLVAEVQPGDLIAVRYPPGYGGDNTGHIMLVAGVPGRHPSSKPEVNNTIQWEVPVIDSSESGHGKTDTRRKPDGTFGQGVGEGVFRLYSDSAGKAVGYTWSIFEDSDYYDQAARPLIIGRLDPDFKLS
jgi:hypothetical protein